MQRHEPVGPPHPKCRAAFLGPPTLPGRAPSPLGRASARTRTAQSTGPFRRRDRLRPPETPGAPTDDPGMTPGLRRAHRVRGAGFLFKFFYVLTLTRGPDRPARSGSERPRPAAATGR